MKRAALIVALFFATVGTSTAAVRLGGSTPSATLEQEVTYFNQGNWHGYWGLMSARFHAACPYSRFVARNQYARKIAGHASVQILQSRVSGSRAYLTYETSGTKIPSVLTKNDVFVRVAGRWYDELDRSTAC